eukprot:TRINITY_DN71264_c0_g1_i1.p1 TRINITY_DN71264_c0_g1~~TRINITY_DN71264_c0_g1_i1.p1  ORF type:complete len:490 (+),score=165.19 TRINITY_DN71264_c0_g1_i1:73-1542(+)
MSRVAPSASASQLSASRVSDSRREKLMNLRQREELKDKLTEKFKDRFGHDSKLRGPDEVSVTSTCIRREVDAFAKKAHVSETNLNRLERRLHCKATQQKPMSTVSAYSGLSKMSQRSASLSALGKSVISPSECPEAFDWSRLDEYASHLHEQDAIRQQMGVRALQKKLKLDLDQQVAEKNARQSDMTEEDRRYHQNTLVELERWKAAEQKRANDLKQKTLKEKLDRDEQLAFEQKLKSEEMQRKKHEEACLVEKIVTEMEGEQRKHEKKKRETKAAMRKVFQENEEDQRKRDEERRAQQQRESDAMKEYNRILDEQEEARANEMAARMERQKQLMEQLQSNVAAQSKNAGDNDAKRANAQQAEMDRHYFEAESAKQKRLKQMRLETQAYLMRQMGEKEGRKEEERQLANIQATILEKDTEEYNHVERQKAIDKRLKNFENRQELEKQITVRAGQRAPEMSSAEIAMNKPLLSLVHRTLKTREQALNAEE